MYYWDSIINELHCQRITLAHIVKELFVNDQSTESNVKHPYTYRFENDTYITYSIKDLIILNLFKLNNIILN